MILKNLKYIGKEEKNIPYKTNKVYRLQETRIRPYGMSHHIWVKINKQWTPYSSLASFLNNWQPV